MSETIQYIIVGYCVITMFLAVGSMEDNKYTFSREWFTKVFFWFIFVIVFILRNVFYMLFIDLPKLCWKILKGK